MKDRVFKVVWVDPKGRLWSAMKGIRGFFRERAPGDILWHTCRPLRYRVGKEVIAAPNMKPYLFAFASVSCAVEWVKSEFEASPSLKDKRILPCFVKRTGERCKFNKGYLEIWEAFADTTKFSKKDQDMYDSLVMQNMPYGTILCRTIQLNTQVTNLL